jgi:chromosome partitioning protein
MGQVIAVCMHKGGVGKTSLVSNLSAGIQATRTKKKTLMVDCDPQGNIALTFGYDPDDFEKTVREVMLDGLDIRKATISIKKNLDMVPCNSDMLNFEYEVIQKFKDPQRFFALLGPRILEVENKYDYIFIDTPPSLGIITGNALACADKVLIPFEPDFYSVKGLIKVIEACNLFIENGTNPNLKILGVVGMKVDLRTSLHSDLLQKAKAYLYNREVHIFETLIPRSIRFASAIAYEKKPAVWTDKSNLLVAAYFDLLDEILEVL